MNLYTGKIINSYSWEELPIDDQVTEQVESISEEESQPRMHDGHPFFE